MDSGLTLELDECILWFSKMNASRGELKAESETKQTDWLDLLDTLFLIFGFLVPGRPSLTLKKYCPSEVRVTPCMMCVQYVTRRSVD